MGKIRNWLSYVFLFGMLISWNVQIVEGNTTHDAALHLESLYGYQSFSEEGESQQLYRDIAQSLSEFEETYEDVTKVFDESKSIYEIGRINYAKYGISTEDAKKIYHYFRYDHPQYYWLSNSFAYNSKELIFLMEKDYCQAAVRESYDQQIDGLIGWFLATALERNYTQDEKVAFLHDVIISHAEYAYYEGTKIPVEEDWAHNITGYLDGKGVVCEGYSKMFQLLLNEMGIENIYVTGLSRNESHAWNMVKMSNGGWYWFDLTWDDRDHVNEFANRVYYAMPNSLFLKDHVAYTKGEYDRSLYALPEANDDYTYYCASEAEKVDISSPEKMITSLQDKMLQEIKNGNHCAVFEFQNEAEFKIFSEAMFGGFVKPDGSNFYFYQMYLGQVPEIRKTIGNAFEYQLVGDNLYFYFDYATKESAPAVTLYSNNQRVGSYGTIEEAYAKMTNSSAEYNVKFNMDYPYQLLPKNVAMPKVKSITFSGSDDMSGRLGYLFLAKDTTLTTNVSFNNICIMGVDKNTTKLNLNGYTLKATKGNVYLGNNSNPAQQAVKLVGDRGNVSVAGGTQLILVEDCNIPNLELAGGDAGSWVYLNGGGTIGSYKGIGLNGYLIVNEKSVSVKSMDGNGYIFPSGTSGYNCTVGSIGKGAEIGFIINGAATTSVRVQNNVYGNVYALYNIKGMSASAQKQLMSKKQIYAPNVGENQFLCLVSNSQGVFAASDWRLAKQKDGYFIITTDPYTVQSGGSSMSPGMNNSNSGTNSQQMITNPQFPGATSNNGGNSYSGGSSQVNGQSNKKYLSVGTQKEDASGVTYKVVAIANGEACVAYTKPKKNAKGTVTIPDTVVIDGNRYKVTAIADKAFKKNKKIKTIKIGVNVSQIGKEAFSGCSKLKTIKVSSKVLNKVGKNACKGIQKKATIKVPKDKVKEYTKLFKKKGQAKTVKIKK